MHAYFEAMFNGLVDSVIVDSIPVNLNYWNLVVNRYNIWAELLLLVSILHHVIYLPNLLGTCLSFLNLHNLDNLWFRDWFAISDVACEKGLEFGYK